MNRAELARMLRDQTAACEPARAALLDGGDFVVWGGSTPSPELAGLYARRLRRTRKQGAETLALPSTVDILTGLEAAQVRIGCIRSPDRTWTFMHFLAEDAGTVIACTGVRRAKRFTTALSTRITDPDIREAALSVRWRQ